MSDYARRKEQELNESNGNNENLQAQIDSLKKKIRELEVCFSAPFLPVCILYAHGGVWPSHLSVAISVACIVTKQHSVCGRKYLLETPGNAISETLNFKMSLDASVSKNLCFWCEFN